MNIFAKPLSEFLTKYRSMDSRARSRFLVLFISLILLIDYGMFCYLTDKNVFNIFPTIPCLDSRRDIYIYLPDREAKSILKEKRKVLISQEKEVLATMLYHEVVRGSIFDNTAAVVPIKTFVRRAWVYGDTCVIDIDFEIAKTNISPLEGSFEAFSVALEKTLRENIPGVQKAYLLINGIKRFNW
ncbi:MAG: hypothetical protein N2316_06055 [Spirochaetes bacterium]|nr:hypothetical protein [Spirochaetota bacterium]